MNQALHRRIWKFLDGFFPLRLVLSHFKYNLIAVLYWVILFGVVAGKIAANYGVPYLFLSPEYGGKTSWMPFLFMGFGFGGFVIAFNIYSYKTMGKVYPFISTLSRPFNKFVINNSTFPLFFCLFYIYKLSVFQYYEESKAIWEILLYVVSFLFGCFLFISLSFLYFFPTNKDFYKLTGEIHSDLEEEPFGSYFHKQEKWKPIKHQDKKRYIYFSSLIRIRVSRSITHYDRKMMDKVFTQNYLNATLFEIVTLIAFFLIGFFKELPFFQFPAGMSIVLLMTVILMIFSILVSWFRKWAYPFIIIFIFSLNYLSNKSSLFRYNTYVYGLDYSQKNIKPYSWKTIQKVSDDTSKVNQSYKNMIAILENWKKQTGEEKPKLVLTMTSGGGSRSAVWVFEVMHYLDSISNNKYTSHLQMITGASGGMVGAAYYRSLLLEQQINSSFTWNTAQFRENISTDLLNTPALSASVNDLFFRLAKFQYGDKFYSKDRGYSFEYQLHKNTNNIFEHPLGYYKFYEKTAQIPLMIFSPTIVNDGRRLLISSQPLNFLCHRDGLSRMTKSYENIDMQSFLAKNHVDNIRFSSVLRMNASFPYILPMTSLPTNPKVEVMDAGIRDNYGAKVSLEYLYKLKEWIQKNTSGVIIVQIRDRKKLLTDEKTPRLSLFSKLTYPAISTVKNLMKIQDYDIDEMIELASGNFAFPVNIVCLDLKENENTQISLSWHLTKNEKAFIKKAIYSSYNQNEFKYFNQLLTGK